MAWLDTAAGRVSAVSGALLALAAVVVGTWSLVGRLTGSRVVTATDDFAQHLAAEQQWHSQAAAKDSAVSLVAEELHGHVIRIEDKQSLVEGVIFTEQCLENSYDMLARQQLIRVCDSLAIHRVPHDIPPSDREP